MLPVPHRALLFFLSFGFLLQAARSDEAAWTPQEKAILAASQKSHIKSNLTYLSDMIGPRVTGSAALRKANDWAAAKMREYGLSSVRLEPWVLPEGWQRGSASGRILEPENGRILTLASLGWHHGTKGAIQGHVVVITATKSAELAAYKGTVKDAIVLDGAPKQLRPLSEIEKPGGPFYGSAVTPDKPGEKAPAIEEIMAFRRERTEFLKREGAQALLLDSAKHHGLLMTGGGWRDKDRASAVNILPTAFVAHEHYALLHRLASRPAPAVTRVELDISNRFLPGPLLAYNTVGEIRGSDRADEIVVLGAHLDSWDLGQGTLDNGTGTSVILEVARLLSESGVKPRRTIRFVLFTGEEQGLHGSKAFVRMHKEELARTSACLVHDSGTGKVLGLGWLGRPELKPILENELAPLKKLGITELHGRGSGGSDHVSFDQAGVPAAHCMQEVAGYRFAHHSQADTLEMMREPDLIQGAQVVALAGMRLANLDTLLPRPKK